MILLLLIAWLTVSQAGHVSFSDCGSEYNLEWVDVEGCNKAPCAVMPGEKINVTFRLVPEFVSREIHQTVYLTIRTIHTNVVVTPKPCTPSYKCPILTTSDPLVKTSIVIPELPTGFDSTLYWKQENENSDTTMCFELATFLCRKDLNTGHCLI